MRPSRPRPFQNASFRCGENGDGSIRIPKGISNNKIDIQCVGFISIELLRLWRFFRVFHYKRAAFNFKVLQPAVYLEDLWKSPPTGLDLDQTHTWRALAIISSDNIEFENFFDVSFDDVPLDIESSTLQVRSNVLLKFFVFGMSWKFDSPALLRAHKAPL